ncbi:heavy-metal-associated domain-containing protein [Roseateles toxinivorans]|uniref:Copper chaperone n=1 Tax=Roseateles toxinivorans TaxID=270368 RepID=A0A4R6QBA2_9BURK|nr:heavy-metal-associated domain-containing protein [Roseateles toxinivorans]TDP59535.1 copper chaperone [Roseateles toxinivorans]
MIAFQIKDLRCGHCASKTNRALRDADPQARVYFDVPALRVEIDAGYADTAELSEAITAAGYTPVPV